MTRGGEGGIVRGNVCKGVREMDAGAKEPLLWRMLTSAQRAFVEQSRSILDGMGKGNQYEIKSSGISNESHGSSEGARSEDQ